METIDLQCGFWLKRTKNHLESGAVQGCTTSTTSLMVQSSKPNTYKSLDPSTRTLSGVPLPQCHLAKKQRGGTSI